MFAFSQFTGSVEPLIESVEFCSNHENCETRHAHIKMTKGFVSKEPVKGRMVSPQSQLFCMFSVMVLNPLLIHVVNVLSFYNL